MLFFIEINLSSVYSNKHFMEKEKKGLTDQDIAQKRTATATTASTTTTSLD
jgi:hypothetical protein